MAPVKTNGIPGQHGHNRDQALRKTWRIMTTRSDNPLDEQYDVVLRQIIQDRRSERSGHMRRL